MKKRTAIIPLSLLALLLAIPVEEPQITTQYGLKLYHDSNLTSNCTSLYWGELAPDSSKSKVTYLISNSNATIVFTTGDWEPEDAWQFLTLAWNITGYAEANTTTPILWTLYASPNITVLTFTFNINITIQ